MSSSTHVLIAGAGLAGPALAVALAKQSIKCTILERRQVVQDIGGVIMLAPNAMRVMEKILEIAPQLRKQAEMFDAIHLYSQKSNAVLSKIGGFVMGDTGIPAISIARPVLHHLLLDECRKSSNYIDIRYGAKIAGIEENSEGVHVILENGDQVKGSILIGADGIGSIVRKHVLGEYDVRPVYAGYVSIGCVVPRSEANLPCTMELPSFLYTPSGTFLIFAMDGEQKEIQWATSWSVPERDRKLGWKEFASSGDAVRQVKLEYQTVTAEPIRTLVNYLSNENLRLWAPYEIPALTTWHTDRVLIIGDAAHAVSPSVGQGSAQAFEDIGLLSRLLVPSQASGKGQGHRTVFEFFERTRKKRTDMIRKTAAKAEGSRGKSTSSWMWWSRSWGMWAALNIAGKGGYVKGGDIVQYDVTAEKIRVD